MADRKAGCAVHVAVTCTDENGEVISDIPSGGWYGMDRAVANALATDINNAAATVIEGYNEALYGPKWREKILQRAGVEKPQRR